MHTLLCELDYFPLHDYNVCSICSNSIHGCMNVVDNLQGLMDRRIIIMTRRIKRNEEVHYVNMVQGCPGEFRIYNVC